MPEDSASQSQKLANEVPAAPVAPAVPAVPAAAAAPQTLGILQQLDTKLGHLVGIFTKIGELYVLGQLAAMSDPGQRLIEMAGHILQAYVTSEATTLEPQISAPGYSVESWKAVQRLMEVLWRASALTDAIANNIPRIAQDMSGMTDTVAAAYCTECARTLETAIYDAQIFHLAEAIDAALLTARLEATLRRP